MAQFLLCNARPVSEAKPHSDSIYPIFFLRPSLFLSRFHFLLSISFTIFLFVLFLDHSLGMLLVDFTYPGVLCERAENSGIEFSVSFEKRSFESDSSFNRHVYCKILSVP